MVISSDKVVAVDVEVPDSGPLILQADHSWHLQQGDKGAAYRTMHQQVADYTKENGIARVVIKASALSQGAMRLAHLESAELRGVVISAAATVAATRLLTKAHISRTFGSRKVDEYIGDDSFWATEISGSPLRIGSREAAMVLLASRNAK
jgi:hypothetical protein